MEHFVPSQEELEPLRASITDMIQSCGLLELGNYYHYFGPHAVTATVCLAESHLTFHTWPEEGYVTIDVFVCNYNGDNTEAARRVYQYLVDRIFKAQGVKTTEIIRKH